MDFGAFGFDGLQVGSDPEAKQKLYGSGFFKQRDRPPSEDAEDWRAINGGKGGPSKVAKLSDVDCFSVSAPKAASVMLPQRSVSVSSSSSLYSNAQQSQNMLCFSSPSSPLHKSESQSPALPCFGYAPSVYSNYAGQSSGGVNGVSMSGVSIGGGRGPFTPSQWMELEHQALIYKYIHANIPVPSNLLIPIRKAFESAGFYYASGLLRPNSMGWGGFQLGFSNSTDPEPGRCRRTDGKKWRCSRDAVADQKYCERHMNRGRHRSRKPVEGLLSGHPASGGPNATTATTCATTATTPSASAANKSGLQAGSLAPCGGASHNNFGQFQQGVLSLSADSSLNRFFMNKESSNEKIQNPSSGFSIVSPSVDLKSKSAPHLFESSSLDRTSSLFQSYQNLGTLKDLTHREAGSNHSVRQFMNDWPGMNVPSSEATHLSISVPMGSNDSRVTLSPLRSAHEVDQVQMNLGVGGPGTVYNEQGHKQTMNWIPISWENSMGGPLGEVLHNANNSNNSTECKNSSVLNLMTEGWESSSSSPLGSSPTGVLQKAAFGSVSNSSAGSSPRAEDNRSKPLEGAAIYGEL